MNMDHPSRPYTPLLQRPIHLHTSREPAPCNLTPAQCAYKSRYWVFWYEADHVFALSTVYFLLAVIAVFSIVHFASHVPRRRVLSRQPLWRRCIALTRYCHYKSWRFANRNNSQSFGAYLLLALGSIFFSVMVLGPQPYYWPTDAKYGNSPPIATRSGWMALACLPFILLLGAKANMVTAVTGISHEKLNLWHSWLAWAMFVLALIHTFPFVVHRHNVTHDLHRAFVTSGIWITGVIALVAQAWLTFMSVSWIRNKLYEFFKATHFFFAIAFVVFFFLHCAYTLTSWDYFIAAVSLYSASLLFAFVETFFGHGVSLSAQLICETSHTLRITIPSKYYWKPGQHVFLRFITCKLHSLTAHPLTICSIAQTGQMTFFVQRRHGLTGRLALQAEKPKDISVLVEGPYGGMPKRWHDGFDHTLLVAGGSGCGLTLALIESWIRQRVGKLHVVLATRDPEMRIWYLRELQLIAQRQGIKTQMPDVCIAFCETSQDYLDFDLIDKSDSVGQPASNPCAFDVQFSRGRPDTKAAVHRLASIPDITVGMVVCGPGGMVHDVGVAAAEAQLHIFRGRGAAEVYLHREIFS